MREEYVKDDLGYYEAVYCKVCGCQIKALIDSGYNTEDGRPLAMLTELPNYAELILEMDDGTQHHTCVCKNCCTPYDNELQEIYKIDERRMKKLDPKLNWGDRKPKKARRIK